MFLPFLPAYVCKKPTSSQKCPVSFTDSMCDKVLGVGISEKGLPYVQITSPKQVSTVVQASSDLVLRWHAWLGHPCLSKMQLFVPSLRSILSLECESCQLSKHTRSSFLISVQTHSSKPLDLIHSVVTIVCNKCFQI